MFFPLLFLAACSDYNLAPEVAESTSMIVGNYQTTVVIPDDTETEVPVEDTAETENDSGSEEDESVFTSRCGTYSDHDIDGAIVTTESFPEVLVMSPTEDTIFLKQGDPLTLEAAVGALDDCGSYMIRELVWSMSDYSEGAVWILSAWDVMPDSSLVETTTSTTFSDATCNGAGFGLIDGEIVEGGTQWVWRTPESNWANGVEITSQHIHSSTDYRYQFTWNGSASAPVGSELTFSLSYGWDDDATGYRMAPNDADREITVIITE